MIGFSPGFPYMGELPPQLVTPRRETPRVKVPQRVGRNRPELHRHLPDLQPRRMANPGLDPHFPL